MVIFLLGATSTLLAMWMTCGRTDRQLVKQGDACKTGGLAKSGAVQLKAPDESSTTFGRSARVKGKILKREDLDIIRKVDQKLRDRTEPKSRNVAPSQHHDALNNSSRSRHDRIRKIPNEHKPETVSTAVEKGDRRGSKSSVRGQIKYNAFNAPTKIRHSRSFEEDITQSLRSDRTNSLRGADKKESIKSRAMSLKDGNEGHAETKKHDRNNSGRGRKSEKTMKNNEKSEKCHRKHGPGFGNNANGIGDDGNETSKKRKERRHNFSDDMKRERSEKSFKTEKSISRKRMHEKKQDSENGDAKDKEERHHVKSVKSKKESHEALRHTTNSDWTDCDKKNKKERRGSSKTDKRNREEDKSGKKEIEDHRTGGTQSTKVDVDERSRKNSIRDISGKQTSYKLHHQESKSSKKKRSKKSRHRYKRESLEDASEKDGKSSVRKRSKQQELNSIRRKVRSKVFSDSKDLYDINRADHDTTDMTSKARHSTKGQLPATERSTQSGPLSRRS